MRPNYIHSLSVLLVLGPHGSMNISAKRAQLPCRLGLIERRDYGPNGERSKRGPWVLTDRGKAWRNLLAEQLRQLIHEGEENGLFNTTPPHAEAAGCKEPR